MLAGQCALLHVMVFSLLTRPGMCIHTRLENGILWNGQQSGSAVNSCNKFEGIRTRSSHRAPHVSTRQFQIMVNAWIIYLNYHCWRSTFPISSDKNNQFIMCTMCGNWSSLGVGSELTNDKVYSKLQEILGISLGVRLSLYCVQIMQIYHIYLFCRSWIAD